MIAKVRRRYWGAGILLVTATLLAAILNHDSPHPTVENYYTSWGSRLGYWLLVGNVRHCGYWEEDTWWPFPFGRAQRVMEQKLYTRLGLSNGSRVLDAGAGSGFVAVHMSMRGLQVEAIDLTPLHVRQANRLFQARGLDTQLHAQWGNYHNLTEFANSTFDGVYTMETFAHADDPSRALAEFYRVLKPGGVLALHEPDFRLAPEPVQRSLRLIHCGHMGTTDPYEVLLQQAGFAEVSIQDITEHTLPMWRIFGVLGWLPYKILGWVGVQHRFGNVLTGVEMYRHWGGVRYLSMRATKR